MKFNNPTIWDVAKEAGVSISTVSNALTGRKNVSEDLRLRIDGAVKKLGYRADPAASSLKSRSSHMIGFIVPSIDSAFFPAVIRGMQAVLEERGYVINFYATGFHEAAEKQYVRMLMAARADAIILGSVSRDREYLRSLASLEAGGKPIPVVALEQNLTGCSLSSVYIDNRAGGRMAAEHLLEMGVRRPAHILGLEDAPWSAERWEGFREAFAEAGIDLSAESVRAGGFTLEGGYRAAGQLIRSDRQYDGIFAANDLSAAGCLQALLERGIRVPEDIRLIGFDNIDLSALTAVPITSVDVPKGQLGKEAGYAVLRAMENGAVEDISLPLTLIRRRSTDPRCASDSFLQALRGPAEE